MSESNKVVLPKDVADGLKILREYLMDDVELLTLVYDGKEHGFSDFHLLLQKVRGHFLTKNQTEIMSALVNGYEVEKSTEEKVREYYESVYGQGDYGGITREAIENTLDLLSITISGVNA
jgi:hypothetical protein